MVTNEVLNTILRRKGVKQYKSDPVPRELLETIVAAGALRPPMPLTGRRGILPW